MIYAQEINEEERLRAVEQELRSSQSDKAQLQQRQEQTASELTALRTGMIGIAKTIQEQEYSLTVLENRLNDLERREAKLKSTLDVRDAQMQRTIMALQRMALRPEDAVTLSPLKPDDAVRTAILLRAALPAVQTSAHELQGELGELYKVRAEMTDQQQQIASAAAGLVEKRRALEDKEKAKIKLQAELNAAADAASAKLAHLANEAADLKDLVSKISAERAAREKQREEERKTAEAKRLAEEKRRAETAAANRIVLKPPPGVEPIANGAAAPPQAKPETQAGSLGPPPIPRSGPADLRPFSKARGTMPMPAVGPVKRKFGEDNAGSDVMNKGVVISARADGQVIAPFDGIVAFAGPFRGYGLLLIIEHSEGYHTLLAGLGRIDCVLDQRVFAGEPVGVMNGPGASELYVELRQNGQPVNPLPWLTSRAENKSSG